MKYKTNLRILLAGFVYLGCVAGNAAFHYGAARGAIYESQQAHYGPNLKRKWEDYARSHLERMTSPLMLVPFSSLFDTQEVPLEEK